MTPKLLPLIASPRHGSRSSMTCHYRCNNACDAPVPNETDNPRMRDLVEGALARRSVLKGSAVGAGALVVGGLGERHAAAASRAERPSAPKPAALPDVGRAAFTPVAPNRADAVTNAPEFTHNVVIRWGDPVEAGAPALRRRTPRPRGPGQAVRLQQRLRRRAAARRPPARCSSPTTSTPTRTSCSRTGAYDDATIKRIAMAAHGMAVVTIERGRATGSWVRADHRRAEHNRRITVHTAFAARRARPPDTSCCARPPTRPAARVLGTFGNCAGGTTPWGTVLSGEENFNGYFDASGPVDPADATSFKRYGLATAAATNRGWSSVDERFDLAKHPHEAYRFGWVVEIDPFEPDSTPGQADDARPLQARGRQRHDRRRGHAVAYMGDDERGDYLYKFVSADTFRKGGSRAARTPQQDACSPGARSTSRSFTGDGTGDGEYDGAGTWIALHLRHDLIRARHVGRRGAHQHPPGRRHRRPDEDGPPRGRRAQPGQRQGLLPPSPTTATAARSYPTDEANPLSSSMTGPALGAPLRSQSGNRNGYVLELDGAPGTTTRARRSRGTSSSSAVTPGARDVLRRLRQDKVSPISCPDNVAFDKVGNLWISTDGNVLGSNDGLFRVPVAGAERGQRQQFLTVPYGAETCGPLVTDDQLSVFIAVQHPGETDGATFEAPTSTWPHTDGFPRPSVVVSYRK